jgi:hypothetical protein
MLREAALSTVRNVHRPHFFFPSLSVADVIHNLHLNDMWKFYFIPNSISLRLEIISQATKTDPTSNRHPSQHPESLPLP